MKFYFLFVLSFCIKATFSQSIYFRTIGDGASNPIAKFGYIESLPFDIYAEKFDFDIDTLYCNNGSIKIKSREFYGDIIPYEVMPEQLGPLTVTLVTSKEGVSDTIKSTISIVERPILRLVVNKTDSLYKLDLLDEDDHIVTDQFSCFMHVNFINDMNFTTGMYINDWKNNLTIDNIIPKKLRERIGLKGFIFNTTAVYSKTYGIFTGNYSCTLKLKN